MVTNSVLEIRYHKHDWWEVKQWIRYDGVDMSFKEGDYKTYQEAKQRCLERMSQMMDTEDKFGWFRNIKELPDEKEEGRTGRGDAGEKDSA